MSMSAEPIGDSDRVSALSHATSALSAGRMAPLKSHVIASDYSRRGAEDRCVDDSAFVVLLWLLAAAAVLPGALDLPFLRGAVRTASQLDSVVGRVTLAGLGLVAAFTILTRIVGTRLTQVFGVLAWAWGSLLLVSWILGDTSIDLIRPLALLLVAIALGLCRIQLPTLLWHARAILRVYLVLCLMSILVAPEYCWLPNTGRRLLGIPQFVGIAPHPNSLGPVFAIALLLELLPGGRRLLRWIFAAVALALLVLSQSRAGWAEGVLVLFVLLLVPEGRIDSRRIPIALLCVIGAAVVLPVAFVFVNPVVDFGDIMNGRLSLWNEISDRAGESWSFGNGMGAFNATARFDNGFATWAGQAHNQFLETVYTGGIFSLAPLVVLVIVCAVRALRSGSHRRVALTAFAVLFIDLWVESPLRPALSASVMMVVIVLAILSARVDQQRRIVVSKSSGDLASDLRSEPRLVQQ